MALDRKSADLHVHTTASDGSLRPAQVVERAQAAGLAAIGIADHDTVDGIVEAVSAGERLGVEVVPAVEINTDVPGKEAHILGYFIDIECGDLHKELARLREARLRRGEEMVARLREAGVPVTMERVLEIADGAPIARPHVARAIVETGAVRSLASAFGRFLIPGAPGYVARYKFSPAQAIQVVRAAGGVACLAHPGKDSLEDLLPELVAAGLKAVEVYHIDHTPAIARRFSALARRYGLVSTGGSDSHGPDAVKPVEIGQVTVGWEVVGDLREAARRGRTGRML